MVLLTARDLYSVQNWTPGAPCIIAEGVFNGVNSPSFLFHPS